MRARILYASGAIALAMAVFHGFFWVLFDWAEELPRLSAENAGIMQMFNIVSLFTFVFQGVASFILAKKLGAFTLAEKSILMFIGGYYFLRAAFGFPLFGVNLAEAIIVLICLAVFVLNLLAVRPLERGSLLPGTQ